MCFLLSAFRNSPGRFRTCAPAVKAPCPAVRRTGRRRFIKATLRATKTAKTSRSVLRSGACVAKFNVFTIDGGRLSGCHASGMGALPGVTLTASSLFFICPHHAGYGGNIIHLENVILLRQSGTPQSPMPTQLLLRNAQMPGGNLLCHRRDCPS